MKFSKQPNGNWCEYSTISDSFYESNMTEQMLLREIIADAALNIAMRYFELTQNNGGLNMGCKEVDGNGNVKVFTFTVRCFQNDDEWTSMRCDKRFVDYTDGWNWARQHEQEVYDNDPDTGTEDAFECKIDYDYEWIPDGQVEAYLQEELNDD